LVFPTFSYLNQQHIKKQKITDTESFYGNLSSDAAEQMEIGELGLDIWRLYMIEYLSSELVRHILEGIAADRASNGTLDHHRVQIINGVIHSFVEVQDYKKTGSLKLYQELFEGPMLEASGAYYTDEANKLLQRCSVSEYMQEVIRILEYGSRRAQKFLHVSSLPKLRKECEEKFINDRIQIPPQTNATHKSVQIANKTNDKELVNEIT